jgi:hypothetical protein
MTRGLPLNPFLLESRHSLTEGQGSLSFSIHKPLSPKSSGRTQLNEAHVNLGAHMDTSAQIHNEFLPTLESNASGVHAIICIDGLSTFSTHWPIKVFDTFPQTRSKLQFPCRPYKQPVASFLLSR